MVRSRFTTAILAAGLLAPLGGCVVYTDGARAGYTLENGEWQSSAQLRLTVTIDPALPATGVAGEPTLIGVWRGDGRWRLRDSDMVDLTLKRNGGASRSVISGLSRAITGLPADGPENGPIAFSMKRDVGELRFEGDRQGDSASGRVHFVPVEQVKARLAHLAGREPTVTEQVDLFMSGATTDLIECLSTLGYTAVPRDIIQLRNNGVGCDYLTGVNHARRAPAQAAAAPIPLDEVRRLRNAGIPSEFVAELSREPNRFSTEEIVKLRYAGATTDYVAAIRDTNPRISIEDIVRLRHNGINSDYYREMSELAGAAGTSVEEVIRFRNHGLQTSYIRAFREAGFSCTSDELISLRNHGVPADFACATREAGYQLTAAELIRLRNAGVSADYIAAAQTPGTSPVPVDSLIEARSKGMSAESVRKMRAR